MKGLQQSTQNKRTIRYTPAFSYDQKEKRWALRCRAAIAFADCDKIPLPPMAAKPMRTDRLHGVRRTERDQAKSSKKRKPVNRIPRSAGTGEWAGRTAVRALVKAAASKKEEGYQKTARKKRFRTGAQDRQGEFDGNRDLQDDVQQRKPAIERLRRLFARCDEKARTGGLNELCRRKAKRRAEPPATPSAGETEGRAARLGERGRSRAGQFERLPR